MHTDLLCRYAALPLRFGDEIATMPNADTGMEEAVQVHMRMHP